MRAEDFAICIPTWNSLDYLKILVESIQKNSAFKHGIYVHDNASDDGTQEYLLANALDASFSNHNKGFCGVNQALKIAVQHGHENIMVMNSDMVALPGWDVSIAAQLKRFKRKGIDKFSVSCRLVEPHGNNPEYIIANFGDTPGNLRKQELYRQRFAMVPSTVQYSHPILCPAKLLASVGYFDEQYWPGWASDHDLAAKLHKAGCRDFVMLGNSHVYHFSSATFKKLPDEDRAKNGQNLFAQKWGVSTEQFRRYIGIRQLYENK